MSTQQEPAGQGDWTSGGGIAGGTPVSGATSGGMPGGVRPGGATAGVVAGGAVAGGAAAGDGTAAQQAGRKVFRLPGPVVLWWAWVVFAVANLADLAIQGHDRTSAQIGIGLLAVTGVVYACALRPRVITDADGLTMLNPIRDHRVPWGRVGEIHLGESVQVRCSPGATGGAKVLHSWALYSPRRSRLRAEVRGRRWDRNLASRPSGYARLPEQAREVAKQTPVELMAREIGSMASRARERGAADGQIVASWAWSSLAAVLVPALALVLMIVVR